MNNSKQIVSPRSRSGSQKPQKQLDALGGHTTISDLVKF